MWSVALHTVRDRWTLFIGAVLSVALGVALVQSSSVLLVAADRAHAAPGATPAEARAIRTAADGVTSLMGISITLGLFLTVFIIGSTLAFTVVERRRELALLRLSGASRRQVRRLLVGEGVIVGVVGTGLGALIGPVATAVELRFVHRAGLDASVLDLRFPSWILLVDLGAGLGSALAGVLVAARRAGRVRPLDALRETGTESRVMTVGRWTWGLLFGVPAVGGALLVQSSGNVLTSVLVGLLVIVAGSVALQQLSPLVVPLVARAFALPARRHVLGELAQAGMRDGVRRSATTAGPVIVLVGLVVGLLGILSTQTEATRVERIQQSSADLVVVSHGDVSDRIRAVPGVAVVDPETDVDVPLQAPRARGGWRPVGAALVTAVDPAGYTRLTHQPLDSGELTAFAPGSAVLGPSALDDGLGDLTTVRVGGRQLEVVARVDTTIAGGADVLVDRADIPAARLRHAPTTTFVEIAPGTPVADVRRELAGLGTVSTVSEWADDLAREQSTENGSVMLALAGLGGLYAFLSLVNAVAVGTAQRRREFAVARVTGASRRQMIAAVAIESLGVGAIGIALGATVVAVCMLGIRHGMEATLGVPVMEIPWGLAAGLGAAVLVAGAAAAAAAGWSATRDAPIRLVAARE
ncbi:ABC transporter permease [Nocardioides panacisoli]|uniref:ABC3 transporter permease C-terminal domain-containing protein n=1 Tax=Nocardioides panacisoli TaxID=627624 RepID=A0ABP7I155_9ACTN